MCTDAGIADRCRGTKRTPSMTLEEGVDQMTTSVDAVVRILEVGSCGECPHLDDRWTSNPWDCTLEHLAIRRKDRIHRRCPLDTKQEYLDANVKMEGI